MAATARAMWKASLEVGDVHVAVKLYAAVEERDVRFRLLHAADRRPVKQRVVDPRTAEEVMPDAIRRGVEVEPGVFVVMTPGELDLGAPEASRAIEVTRFVPPAAIDFAWYSRPYFLGPDGSAAEYAALVEALRESNVFGIAHWTMRGKRYAGALAARDRHLALLTLRSAAEVVAASQLPAPSGKAVSAAERTLAKQLLAALDGPFDPALLRDEYRESLVAYLAAKAKGRRVKATGEAAPGASLDLARALKESLQAVKKRRAA